MSAFITPFLPFADGLGGHHGWDGDGWWIVMALGMLVFWGLVIAGGMWLARELRGERRPHASPPVDSGALEVLDRRLAEGAISIEEYGERRRALIDARQQTPDGG